MKWTRKFKLTSAAILAFGSIFQFASCYPYMYYPGFNNLWWASVYYLY